MASSYATKSEILAALSHALDLVEGQPRGHAERTCAIAMRIGRLVGLDDRSLADLHFAALLKDAGCSANSARVHKIFGGDEILIKRKVKVTDWSRPLDALLFGAAHTEVGNTLLAKLRKMATNLGPPSKIMNEVTAARCHRGAAIALSLGFGTPVADAVSELDEHWDGKGSPLGLQGDRVSLLARIVGLAQTLEVFATTYGVAEAMAMLQARSGRWFDPDLVRAALTLNEDAILWEAHFAAVAGRPLALDLPDTAQAAEETEIDAVCTAFASIIDAKSAFTGDHSTRVTEYAVRIASALGIEGGRLTDLRRAALLHDVGKLGVSNGILDKPARLTEDEFLIVRDHPRHSYEILRHIQGFGEIARIASAHHERLDGRGYWQGLGEEELSLEMRCLTAADVYDALTADRPYRSALSHEKAMEIMEKDATTAFDPRCLEALDQVMTVALPAAA